MIVFLGHPLSGHGHGRRDEAVTLERSTTRRCYTGPRGWTWCALAPLQRADNGVRRARESPQCSEQRIALDQL